MKTDFTARVDRTVLWWFMGLSEYGVLNSSYCRQLYLLIRSILRRISSGNKGVYEHFEFAGLAVPA